jgi:hypothetical protein
MKTITCKNKERNTVSRDTIFVKTPVEALKSVNLKIGLKNREILFSNV